MLRYDSGNKSVDIICDPDDNTESTAIIIFQQSAYINLKITDRSLKVTKPY